MNIQKRLLIICEVFSSSYLCKDGTNFWFGNTLSVIMDWFLDRGDCLRKLTALTCQKSFKYYTYYKENWMHYAVISWLAKSMYSSKTHLFYHQLHSLDHICAGMLTLPVKLPFTEYIPWSNHSYSLYFN